MKKWYDDAWLAALAVASVAVLVWVHFAAA